MNTIGKVICKSVGVAGMSAVLYDAFSVAKANSHRVSLSSEADRFERIHATKRTLTTESPVTSAMQEKIADIRMNNAIFPAINSTKGGISGFLTSLGDNFIPITFASMALVAKGSFAKIGAWGVGGCALFTVLKEGFGLFKKTPIDH